MGASVVDLYGTDFGLQPEQIVEKTLEQNNKLAEENKKYQETIKQCQISGTHNYLENNKYIEHSNVLPGDNFKQNEINVAPRMMYSDINNELLSSVSNKNSLNFFNRFQKEFFGDPSDNIVTLLQEILFIAKIILLVLVLILVICIFNNNKNN